jgi:hypothetical protein
MTMNVALVLFGAALNLAGAFAYIRDTIRGTTKPNRVSWFLWGTAPLIAVAASLSSGVTLAVLPVFMSAFCPLLVFGASFWNPNAYWKLEWFDYACGAFSLLALALWAITSNALVAIFFAILADFAAGYPTLIKAWRYPETETMLTYALALVSFLPSFIVAAPSYEAYAFPVYLVVMNASIVMAIVWGRRRARV